MKKIKWSALFLLMCSLSIVSCSKSDEVEDGFTEMETGKGQVGTNTGESCVTAGVSEYTSTTATMYGYINVTDDVMQTAKFGFIWTRSNSELTYEKNEGMIVVNETTGSQYYTTVKGFTPGRKYYYRAFVKIGSNYVYGIIKEFKTQIPSVSTEEAKADITSATLNGHVNICDGDPFTCGFYYSADEANFDKRKSSYVCKVASKDFSNALINLTPGHKYFYQAYVSVGDTVICGKVKDFTTSQPTVTTLEPTSVGCFSAELAGKTNASGVNLTYDIGKSADNLQYRTTGSRVVLQPNTTYYYRAVYGDIKGEVKSFTTMSPKVELSEDVVSEGSRVLITAKSNLTQLDLSSISLRFECSTSSSMSSSTLSGTATFDAEGNISAYANVARSTKYYARASFSYVEVGASASSLYTSDAVSFTTPLVANNGHEYVDLGLKSKTLWATCNVGATSPTESGSHLNEKYDPQASWGGEWRKPTKTQFEELVNDCRWSSVSGGYKITGPNGKSITLPHAGYTSGSLTYKVGSEGYYWTGSSYNSTKYYFFHMYSTGTKSVTNVSSSTYYSYRLVINQ